MLQHSARLMLLMLQWVVHVVDSHTPGVALPTFAETPLGMAQGYARQVEFGELVYGMYTRGEPLRVSEKNETGPLILRVIFGGAKTDP